MHGGRELVRQDFEKREDGDIMNESRVQEEDKGRIGGERNSSRNTGIDAAAQEVKTKPSRGKGKTKNAVRHSGEEGRAEPEGSQADRERSYSDHV
jgi:hypothetical protein